MATANWNDLTQPDNHLQPEKSEFTPCMKDSGCSTTESIIQMQQKRCIEDQHNAQAAKAALDVLQRKGRVLRTRFASHGAALKVKNLHPYVSNELLEQSFSQFGDLKQCVVIVDDRGKPTGEGIVEFVHKPGANSALRRITEGVFLMGADPRPIAVEPLEQKDEEDGLPEKFLTKTDQYKKEREKEPRFAPPGTFEYEFRMRWKQIEELEKQRFEQIKKDTEDARLLLEGEMEDALYEYQAEQKRQDISRCQEELMRLEELRTQHRLRRQQKHEIRRQQEDCERAQREERLRADTMMMMRQHELARGRVSGPMDIPGMRGREEMRAGMRGEPGCGRGSGAPPLQPPPAPANAERGGPNAAAEGAAAQSGKPTSPRPLMQGSGFGGAGGVPGAGLNHNPPTTAADANAMGPVEAVEPSQTAHIANIPWDITLTFHKKNERMTVSATESRPIKRGQEGQYEQTENILDVGVMSQIVTEVIPATRYQSIQQLRSEASGRSRLQENSDSGATLTQAEASQRNSPEHCPICLEPVNKKSFTNSCIHSFCFGCLKQWSKVKAQCPVCRCLFTGIIHNIRADDSYNISKV